MLILSDLYRVAINVGDRALTPGMKKVFNILFFFYYQFLLFFFLFRLSNGNHLN